MLLKECVFFGIRNFEVDVVGAPCPVVGCQVCVVERMCIFDMEEFRIGCSGCSISIGGWPFLCC